MKGCDSVQGKAPCGRAEDMHLSPHDPLGKAHVSTWLGSSRAQNLGASHRRQALSSYALCLLMLLNSIPAHWPRRGRSRRLSAHLL